MRILFSIFLFSFCSQLATAQELIYLQLEYGSDRKEFIKFYPNDRITFTTVDYPDAWRHEVIKEIKPQDGLIILKSDFVTVDEILKVKVVNKKAMVAGHFFGKFGGAWLVFGALGSVGVTDYKMSLTEVIIGSVASGLGWLLRKLFKSSTYIIDNNYTYLRLMDLRMEVEGDIYYYQP